MKPLKIEASPTTPSVDFNKQGGHLRMEGKCYPSDVISFFDPLLFWIQAYVKDPHPVTQLDFKFSYIGSSALKQLLVFLKTLIPLKDGGGVVINWYISPEDEDMHERGEVLEEMTGMSFNFIETED